jgi:hypothetical protein
MCLVFALVYARDQSQSYVEQHRTTITTYGTPSTWYSNEQSRHVIPVLNLVIERSFPFSENNRFGPSLHEILDFNEAENRT